MQWEGEGITVVKIQNGNKYGRFTPLSWKIEGCWQKDPNLRRIVCNFNLRDNYNHAFDFHNNKLSYFGGYTLNLLIKI